MEQRPSFISYKLLWVFMKLKKWGNNSSRNSKQLCSFQQNCKITDLLSLEGASRDHLIQAPAQSRVHYSGLPRTVSSCVLNISEDIFWMVWIHLRTPQSPWATWFCIICSLAEGPLCSTKRITDKDVKHCWPQYKPLLQAASDRPPAVFHATAHKPLSLTYYIYITFFLT